MTKLIVSAMWVCSVFLLAPKILVPDDARSDRLMLQPLSFCILWAGKSKAGKGVSQFCWNGSERGRSARRDHHDYAGNVFSSTLEKRICTMMDDVYETTGSPGQGWSTGIGRDRQEPFCHCPRREQQVCWLAGKYLVFASIYFTLIVSVYELLPLYGTSTCNVYDIPRWCETICRVLWSATMHLRTVGACALYSLAHAYAAEGAGLYKVRAKMNLFAGHLYLYVDRLDYRWCYSVI